MSVPVTHSRWIGQQAARQRLNVAAATLFTISAVEDEGNVIRFMTVPVFGYGAFIFGFCYRDAREIKYTLVAAEKCGSVSLIMRYCDPSMYTITRGREKGLQRSEQLAGAYSFLKLSTGFANAALSV